MAHHRTSCKEKLHMPSQLIKTVLLVIGIVVGSLTGPSIALAAELETPASIRAAIEAAVSPRLAALDRAAVEIAVGPIDSRLKLPSCPAIEVTLPPTNTAMMTARAECLSPSWTIYVPVRLHAWVEAVVAAVNLAPNTRLSGDYLTRGRVDTFSSNGGLLSEPAQAEGKILRVGLFAGAPITSTFLELPVVVHRGQKVLLTLTASTMTIRTTALALEDGRVGDSIALENPDTRKTVHATVADDGTVEMNF
jgi:flagella basal body P-ring formation protein FlgA